MSGKVLRCVCAGVVVLASWSLVAPVAAHAADEGQVLDISEQPVLAAEVSEAATMDQQPQNGDSVSGTVAGTSVSIPADSSDPLEISRGGVDLRIALPMGESAAPAQAVEGAPTSAVAFDNGDGTATVPVVKNDGTLQIMSVIASPQSNTTFTYSLDAAGGLAARSLPDGGVGVYRPDGTEIATASPPWAKDSRGAVIPTRYEVHGNKITQVVDLSNTVDDQFPIVADPAIVVTSYEYSAIGVIRQNNQTNFNRQVGQCRILRSGSTCTVQGSYSVESSIQGTLGLSASSVSATVGISNAYTVSGSMSCTSPSMRFGQTYTAYATGSFVYYKIQKWKVVRNQGMKVRTLMDTSSTQVAFLPANSISCR